MYYLNPVKDSEVFDHGIKGLIKAGYKGNLSDYYKVEKENKLTGQEIQELIFGKTIEGSYYTIPWSLATNKDGETEYANKYFGVHQGKSWIEGDTVCSQYESLYDGLEYCSEVYKIPEGDNIKSSEYLILNDFMLSPISIKETVLHDSPRKEEVPATTMNSNNIAVDLNGEWHTVYDLKEYGVSKDVVQITQKDNSIYLNT